MRVLLAGGGTAGHTSPLLATADALRRLDPSVEITCLGTPRGLENRVVPEAGYPLELIPPVPLPRRPTATCSGCRGGCAARSRRRWRSSTGSGPTWWSGFGGYVSMPAYLAARRRKLPLVVHEGNALPGLANRSVPGSHDVVAVSFPDTKLPKATYVGLPIRRMICQLDRAALRAEGRAVLRARPGPPDAAGDRRLAGRPADQPGRLRCRAAPSATPGSRCCTSSGRRARPTPADRPARRYVVVPFVDRMDLAYAAADLVVCRAGANTVTEAAAVGLPGGLRAAADRQRRAGAQRPAGRRRRWRPDGGRRRAHPRVGARHVPDLAGDRDRLAAMGAAASGLIPRDADDELAALVLRRRRGRGMRIPVPDELLPAERLGRVHFVGIGGAGLSGIARIMLARGIPVTGSDATRLPGPGGAARPRRRGARRPRRRAGRRRRHRRGVHRGPRRTTPRSSRPATPGCGCCRARRPWPSVMLGARPSRWPAPTARPRPPRC